MLTWVEHEKRFITSGPGAVPHHFFILCLMKYRFMLTLHLTRKEMATLASIYGRLAFQLIFCYLTYLY